MTGTDVPALVRDLRARGIDVIRVSYPDLIGVDRGRDVLLDELETALGHGIAFCRAVYHTTPMGDVVPVQGGIESGLPDISARPDLEHAHRPAVGAGCPVVPGRHHGARRPGRRGVAARGGAPGQPTASHELGLRAVVGPELEFYLLEEDTSSPTGWRRYADAPGQRLRRRPQGRPARRTPHDAALHA